MDWKERIARYEADLSTLQDQYNHIVSSKVLAQYPSYYLKPFHAYDEGNLSWQAAMEVESAALTVHAQIFPLSTPSLTTASDTVLDEAVQTKKKDKVDIPLNPMGDFLLRDNFHKNMLEMLQGNQHVRINRILDIGCSTGLSTLKLHESFPQAEIIGMDLSPYMLAGT